MKNENVKALLTLMAGVVGVALVATALLMAVSTAGRVGQPLTSVPSESAHVGQVKLGG